MRISCCKEWAPASTVSVPTSKHACCWMRAFLGVDMCGPHGALGSTDRGSMSAGEALHAGQDQGFSGWHAHAVGQCPGLSNGVEPVHGAATKKCSPV